MIEIDGGQHYHDEIIFKDIQRDNDLRSLGLTVLRFSDADVFDNLIGVIEEIWRHL